ncbi:probable pectate lyase 3 [Rosa rugosa]|uniref:probable pectate lyase 3 n=1 Tax=Rosa rugosa TaxID=74645 RepID=UPI002B40B0E3|nr:probable pectate lyase 3 [Rosa rugosa]
MAAKRIYSLIFLFLFLLAFIAVIVSAEPGPVEDAYWKKREADAQNVAEQSVEPHPEQVTEELNTNVGQLVSEQDKHH